MGIPAVPVRYDPKVRPQAKVDRRPLALLVLLSLTYKNAVLVSDC